MGDESQPTHEVFISYSSKDKKWADAACAVLEKHRVRCWVAPRDITPGTEWGAAIISGMDASKIMVVIFSAHANQSAQVRREVERAIGKGLIVLPFRVEDVSPAGAMEYALSNTHWLDGFTPPLERQFDLLARSVKTLLGEHRGNAAEPPAPPVITPAPSWPHGRLLIAGGLTFLMVIVVAGLVAIRRNATIEPTGKTAPRSDQERIQGRWQVVESVNYVTKKKALSRTPVWEFKGTHLTIYRLVDPAADEFSQNGSFSLSAGGERKLFDFSVTGGRPFELLGIYDFEGEFLKICYWVRLDFDPNFKRPDSFAAGPGTERTYLKFRHLGDR
ncbi:MAG: TIR domain-containing protein [Isosphaeraceae bacterium]